MIDPVMSPSPPGTFASFEGNLDGDRVTRLFWDEPLVDRAKALVVWSLAAAFVFAVGWGMGAAEEIPTTVRWAISGCAVSGVLGCGLLQQFGWWHSRRWLRWNALLTGRYRVTLTDDWVDVETTNLALRLHYGFFAMAESGRSAVRLGFDARAWRALLLPIADCQPPRAVRDVRAFVRERIRDGKRKPREMTLVSDRDLPLPLALRDDARRIEVQGPQREGQLLEAMESDKAGAKRRRVEGAMYVGIAVLFVVVLTLMGVGGAAGQPFGAEHWARLIGLAIFLLFVAVAVIRRWSAKADIKANPDADAGRVMGWISPSGVAAHYRHGYVAVAWAACDAVEIREDRILARLCRGDFLLIGRQMFSSDSDFEQASRWAGAWA